MSQVSWCLGDIKHNVREIEYNLKRCEKLYKTCDANDIDNLRLYVSHIESAAKNIRYYASGIVEDAKETTTDILNGAKEWEANHEREEQ